jgi:general secretion pathway protein J
MTPAFVRPWRSSGFTLLELLVAMAIFAVLGAVAMGGLNAVLGQQAIARTQLNRLHDVQRAVRVLATDFGQINPRLARDALGAAIDPPLLAPCRSDGLVCLNRDGWRNPFWRQARGTLQRVRYRIEEDRIVREHWSVMDLTLANEPSSQVLLDGVEAFTVEFLDGQGNTLETWPADNSGAADPTTIPRAASIVIRLSDWGEIVRTVEIAG